MLAPPKPHNERKRLETLRNLGILDTPPEERFDRVTRLATRLFDVSISLVSLVDADRQWSKSKQGLTACETSREISFCGHAILSEEIFIVEDALKDERFKDNPLVSGKPDIRFYAGYPLHGPDGYILGTLCLIDTMPRTFSDEDRQMLATLGSMIEAELVARNHDTTDELTTLSNLHGFESLADHALAICRRMDRPATLIYLQVEDYAHIQAQGGQAAVYGLLVEFSQMLVCSFRESDVIGRVGEKEFAVLVSGADREDTKVCVGRLQEWMLENSLGNPDAPGLGVAAGLVCYDPKTHSTLGELLSAAAAQVIELQQAEAPEQAAANA